MRLLSLLLLLSSMAYSAIALPKNFQADFIQKITNTKGKIIEYRGKVSFSNETLFKWSYTKMEKYNEYEDLNLIEIASLLFSAKNMPMPFTRNATGGFCPLSITERILAVIFLASGFSSHNGGPFE